MVSKDIEMQVETKALSDDAIATAVEIASAKKCTPPPPQDDLSFPYAEFQQATAKYDASVATFAKKKKNWEAAKEAATQGMFMAAAAKTGDQTPAEFRINTLDAKGDAEIEFLAAQAEIGSAKTRLAHAREKWEKIRNKRSPLRKRQPKKNPNAITPDWTKLCDKEVFFNGKDNEWCIVLFDRNQLVNQLLSTAATEIFDQTGLSSRLTTESVNKYISEKKVYVKDTYVPTKPNLDRKNLCVIPLHSYNEIYEDLLKTPDPDPDDVFGRICRGYFVCVSRNDYDKLFTGLENILTSIGKDYEFAYQSGTYPVPNLKFSNEIKKTKIFKKQLTNLLTKNEIDLGDQALEKIGIMFSPNPVKMYTELASVWVKYIAEQWRPLDKEFASFSKKYPANDKTTLSFILHMPTIYRKYLSENSPSYSQFIEEYYYPPVGPRPAGVRTAIVSNPASSADTDDTFPTPGDLPEEKEPEHTQNSSQITPESMPPGNEIKGLLLSFLEIFNKGIPPEFDVGYSWDKRLELEKLSIDKSIMPRRTQDSLNRIQNIADPIIDGLVDNLEEAEKFRDLYELILDPLSLEGLMSLLSAAISNLAKTMPLEDVMQQMTSAMFSVFEESDVFDFFSKTVGSESMSPTAAKIEAAFVEVCWPALYPDIAMPTTSELFSTLTSHTHYNEYDPTLDFDICLGTPGFQTDNNLERVKEAFICMLDRELVPASEIATVLEEMGSLGDKDVFKQILEFSQTAQSPDIPGGLGAIGNTGPGSTLGALGSLSGPGDLGPITGGSGGGGLGPLAGGVGFGPLPGLGSMGSIGTGGRQGLGSLGSLFGQRAGGSGLGSLDSGLGNAGRGFSPNFNKKAVDVKKHYDKNRTRKKAKLNDLTLPHIPELPQIGLGDMKKLLLKMIMQKLEVAFMAVVKKLLQKIMDAITDAGGMAGPSSPDNVTGSGANAIKDTIKEELLGANADPAVVDRAVNDLMDSLSVWDLEQPRPSNGEVGDFLDDLSAGLSNQQIIDLFSGNARDQTLCEARQVLDNLPTPTMGNALPSNGDIENFFTSVGQLVDTTALQAIKDLGDLASQEPDLATLCDTVAGSLDRTKLLQEALESAPTQLSEDEIKDQLEKRRQRKNDDFNQLCKALINPDRILTDGAALPIKETPNGPIIPPVSNDPRKPEAGLFPMLDEDTIKDIKDMYNQAVHALNALVMTDLTVGNKSKIDQSGFLDMVLAGSKGRPFSEIAADLLIDRGQFEIATFEYKDGDNNTHTINRFPGDVYVYGTGAIGVTANDEDYWYEMPPPRSSVGRFGAPVLVTDADDKIVSDLKFKFVNEDDEPRVPKIEVTAGGRCTIQKSYTNTGAHFKLSADMDLGENFTLEQYQQLRWWKEESKKDGIKKKKRQSYYKWTGTGTEDEKDDHPLEWSGDPVKTKNFDIAIPTEAALDDIVNSLVPPTNTWGQMAEKQTPGLIFANWVAENWIQHTNFPQWVYTNDDGPEKLQTATNALKTFILKSAGSLTVYDDDSIADYSDEQKDPGGLFQQVVTSIFGSTSKMIGLNDRGWYAIPKGQKYVSEGVGAPTQVFLDEAEYGKGSFYIDFVNEQDDDGNEIGPSNWIELYLNAAPMEILGKKAPLFDFNDMATDQEDYFDNMPDDLRLSSPRVGEMDEPPFCRINSRINNAGLAGLIRATVRLYLYDAQLRAVPAFQVFAMSNHNCKALFRSFIVDHILRDVLDESMKVRKIKPDTLGFKGYYYLFLEQVVQTYSNLVALGFEVADENVDAAFANIKNRLRYNWNPTETDRNLDFKNFIDLTLSDIKKVLSTIVKNEMDLVNEHTKGTFRPETYNMMHWVLDNSDFIANNSEDLGGKTDPPWIGTVEAVGSKGRPFALEKYIKLVHRETGEIFYLTDEEAKKELSLGVADYEASTEDAGKGAFVETNFDSVSLTDEQFAEAFLSYEVFGGVRLSAVIAEADFEGIEGISGPAYNVIPLVFHEISFSSGDIANQVREFEGKAVAVLIGGPSGMWNNLHFRVLFERCFPIADIIAFDSIYIMESFNESLTNRKIFFEWGFMPRLSEFYFWNGKMFPSAKAYLKSTIQQYYYGRTADFVEETIEEMFPENKVAAAATKAIVTEAQRELDLDRYERDRMFTMPITEAGAHQPHKKDN